MRRDLAHLQPVMLLGGSGMLGRAWRALLDARGIAYEAPPSAEIDLAQPATIRVEPSCGLVINCAGWTDVDGAEANEHAAHAVNSEGVGLLAQRCAQARAMLVHYSTDYVFDGRAGMPYAIDHPAAPINAYGRSKAAGEMKLRETANLRYLLVRTSWMYAPWGGNFVRTMARLTAERAELCVVNDQTGRPTSAQHLADATARLLEHGATGIYHVTDGGQCTWYELACAVAAHLGRSCRVTPCDSDTFRRPARRPAYSMLDLTLTEAALGEMPHWPNHVRDVLDRMECM